MTLASIYLRLAPSADELRVDFLMLQVEPHHCLDEFYTLVEGLKPRVATLTCGDDSISVNDYGNRVFKVV